MSKNPTLSPYISRVTSVGSTGISLSKTWNEVLELIQSKEITADTTDDPSSANSTFTDWSIIYKHNDKRDLSTFLHFGDDKILLTVNSKTDDNLFPKYPHSVVYKLYEPLPDDVEEKDNVFVVREVLPPLTETVELVPYDQEEEDVLILKVPDSKQVDSPVTKRSTEFKTYDDLVTSDARLKKEIEDKFISGSQKPVDLNIDYSNYENYINFSSAEKRLKNFKYKISLLDGYIQESASLVNITNSTNDLVSYDNKIRKLKSNFDGYESYLYNISSSYKSSSMGETLDASWPKTGSGSYAEPYKPLSASSTAFTNWYGSTPSQKGQIYSASLYDTNNPNRLVNLLPNHISSDISNKQFLDFMDMIGQQFDELWTYTKSVADVTDRQNDLREGFSKDLIYTLAKSLGWDIQDGKDLLELSRIGFGQKVSGSGDYSLYTSGSISSPPEADISKEITKRLIASMPYILKSKGTIGSFKAIMNCYGIPSSILRVREYGGIQKSNQRDSFEISRKFTKALGFRSSQYVTSSWADDGTTSRKPETVELRFRAVSGSDQVLIQKDAKWAIKLKDNASSDNNGTVSFMLSGSDGYKEVSSSLLPVFDGEYYSVMLKKSKLNIELFSFPGFETGSIFNPPFVPGTNSAENGVIKIVSSSQAVTRSSGSNGLLHKNTADVGSDTISYSTLYKNDATLPDYDASIASVSEGDIYKFSAYAKVSSSGVDSVGSLTLFELDSNGNVVNWDAEQLYASIDGGIKTSDIVGLNETDWNQIQVTKTIKFANTSGLGIRFENRKPGSTIYWDEASVRKISTNTDSISDSFSYDLFVKKYDAGLDRILHSSKTSMVITGSNAVSYSYNASWTGSGDLYLAGGPTSGSFSANKLTGSLMEFRLWNEPLKESRFNTHVSNPKSYVGNTPTASYYNLIRRYSFDDNTTLSDTSTIRDVRPNQDTTVAGYTNGFGGVNMFESVVDKTKTIIPNHGPNRRSATKIRIENNFISGSSAGLSRTRRWDTSANDHSPTDSSKLGIYFSPVDAVNEDIVLSFANLDFNKYLGDPRDNFKEQYSELKDVSNEYFKKYDDNNDFWDYMSIIKYYDQSIFKQLRKVIPARTKPHLGTVIEGNIFERPKSPVQRNNPSFTKPFYEDTINILIPDQDHEKSGSILDIKTEYPTYLATITESLFRNPSLYQFSASDNYEDRNLYSGSYVTAKYGGPNYVFSEATGSIILKNTTSQYNQEYSFIYTSSRDFDKSLKKSINRFENFYHTKSLIDSDLDTGYQHITAWNRSFYEGVKNTSNTTLDGDLPIIIRTTSPTVAVPTDSPDSNLTIIDKER